MTEDVQSQTKGQMSIFKAILIGQLVVNLPVTVMIVGVILIGLWIAPSMWWLFLLVGFLAGWVWWAITVPQWRKWALKGGCPPEILHRWAVATGLEWPRGWIFEKTEVKEE